MSIKQNIKQIKDSLPGGVKLVVVTKTRSLEEIMEVYGTGHRIFGESKAQELLPKQEQLPKDIEWHMVGHLQSNKVKYIAPFISLIHSVDKLKLLKVINKEGRKNKRVIPCLLQMHIAEESTKFGMDMEECSQLLETESFKQMHNIEIRGLMGMATFTDNTEKVRSEFRQLRSYFDMIKERYFPGSDTFKELSMGMTNDYELGIEEGSTMIRVGTAIFGERPV